MVTEKKQDSWINEGRGQGYLNSYKPWITVRDSNSQGRSHRVYGHTTKRTHHLLSDLELASFLLLDWNSSVTDIREKFPLSLQTTTQIAEQAQIAHPRVGSALQIMSSDFYVDSKNPKESNFILHTKYVTSLEDVRTIEKLELERRYWESTNTPWYILTEKDIPPTVLHNIKWLYPAMRESSVPIYEKLNHYIQKFTQYPHLTLIELSKKVDQAYGLELGSSLSEIRELLAQRYFIFDITKDYKKLKLSEIALGDFDMWEKIQHVSNQ